MKVSDSIVNEMSVKMIADAGEAKSLCYELLDDFLKGEGFVSKEKIEEVERLLDNAHRSHSSLLQEIARDNELGSTLLLVHAMDILFTTISEFELIRRFIHEIELLRERVAKLEAEKQ
jgi:PTS system cellobiose-specific IIA component